MAGDWVKVEVATPEKPEVRRLARLLGMERYAVFGRLVKFWSWADANSVDGRVDGVASSDVDDVVEAAGFAEALRKVGWLEFDDDAEMVRVPNFDRHSGKSAKNRALKADRQRRYRRSVDGGVDAGVDGGVSHAGRGRGKSPCPREEKKREEKSPPVVPPKGTRLPEGWSLPDDWRAEAERKHPAVTIDREAERFRNYWLAKPGKDGVKRDWHATWRNWCLKADEMSGGRSPPPDGDGANGYPSLTPAEQDALGARVRIMVQAGLDGTAIPARDLLAMSDDEFGAKVEAKTRGPAAKP